MVRGLRKTMLVGASVAAAGVVVWAALRPRFLAWGATCDEVVRSLPGDDLVANPLYVTTRAITVKALPAAVWPWLVQLGQNRGGFYTYDALENLMGLDIHSAGSIRPEWQDLHAGEDYVTLDPDERMKMTIAVLEPERAFVIRSGAPGEPVQGPQFLPRRARLQGLLPRAARRARHAAHRPLSGRLGRHHRGETGQTGAARARALRHGGTHAARIRERAQGPAHLS